MKLPSFFKKKKKAYAIIEGDITKDFLRAALNTNDRNPVLAITQSQHGYKVLSANGCMLYITYKTTEESWNNASYCFEYNLEWHVDEYNGLFVGSIKGE